MVVSANAQRLGQKDPHGMRVLGRRPEGQQIGERVVARHVAARLDRGAGVALRVDDAADGAIGLRERLVDVAGPEVAGHEDVVAPVGLDQRRPGLHRLLGVVHDGQLLVVDLDQVGRLARRPLVLRHDRRHRLADEAHPLGTERVPLDALRPHGRRVVGLHDRVHVVGDFLPGDHVDDPGHGLGGLRVHAPDAGVGVGTPDDGQVEHPVELDVADEGALARCELPVVQRRHAVVRCISFRCPLPGRLPSHVHERRTGPAATPRRAPEENGRHAAGPPCIPCAMGAYPSVPSSGLIHTTTRARRWSARISRRTMAGSPWS